MLTPYHLSAIPYPLIPRHPAHKHVRAHHQKTVQRHGAAGGSTVVAGHAEGQPAVAEAARGAGGALHGQRIAPAVGHAAEGEAAAEE